MVAENYFEGAQKIGEKGVIYYFQIKINMYAVISHSIPHVISSNSCNQNIKTTLTFTVVVRASL